MRKNLRKPLALALTCAFFVTSIFITSPAQMLDIRALQNETITSSAPELTLGQPANATLTAAETRYYFYAPEPMSIAVTLTHDTSGVNMKLFDAQNNENPEYFTTPIHHGTQLNANLMPGRHSILVYFYAQNYDSAEFSIIINEGPRVLTINEEYFPTNTDTPQTFVFNPPMDANYEIITTGSARTGTLYDSILGSLPLAIDDDSNGNLQITETLISQRKYYVTVNEPGVFSIKFQRYEPAGNATLRLEPTETPGKMAVYIDNLTEDVSQISFGLNFDENVDFTGFVPNTELPDGASVFISEDGDWVTFVLLDEELNVLPFSGEKLFYYHFDGTSEVEFSDAFFVAENDVIFPNLEINAEFYVTAMPFTRFILQDLFDALFYDSSEDVELLQGGIVYIQTAGEWEEYVPEPEERGIIEAFSAFAPLSGWQGDEPGAIVQYSEAWLNARRLMGDINLDGRTNLGDHTIVFNIIRETEHLPQLEQRIIVEPLEFLRGVPDRINIGTHNTIFNIMRGYLSAGPVFQVVRPNDYFTANNSDTPTIHGRSSNIMKIGTTHVDGVAVGEYTLEIENTTDVPLFFWLVQNNETTGIPIQSGEVAVGETIEISNLRGLYFLKVSRSAMDNVPVQSGDFSVRVSPRQTIEMSLNLMVAQGTLWNALNLPRTIAVTTILGEELNIPIVWTGYYNQNVLGTYILTGTPVINESIASKHFIISATVTVLPDRELLHFLIAEAREEIANPEKVWFPVMQFRLNTAIMEASHILAFHNIPNMDMIIRFQRLGVSLNLADLRRTEMTSFRDTILELEELYLENGSPETAEFLRRAVVRYEFLRDVTVVMEANRWNQHESYFNNIRTDSGLQ